MHPGLVELFCLKRGLPHPFVGENDIEQSLRLAARILDALKNHAAAQREVSLFARLDECQAAILLQLSRL